MATVVVREKGRGNVKFKGAIGIQNKRGQLGGAKNHFLNLHLNPPTRPE
jgi:hypothetical protein